MENCEQIAVEFGEWLLNKRNQPRFKFIKSNEQLFKSFLEEKEKKKKLENKL